MANFSLRSALFIAALATLALQTKAAVSAKAATDVIGPIALWRHAKQGDFIALDRVKKIPKPSRCLIAAEQAATSLDYHAAVKNVACFEESHDEDPAMQEVAAEVEAGVAFAAGDYGTAARAADAGASLAARLKQSQEAAELAQTAAVSKLLALQPQQKLISGTAHAVPATRDAGGLMRVPAAINGGSIDMIVDTGANLSVLSTSAAKKLGLRIVDGNASVGSSTRVAVGVRIGIADRFELGGLVFRDVAFLILDDRDLSPAPFLAYRIDGIIGFPIFSATSGFSFTSDGTFIPAPPSNAGVRATLRAIGSDLFVEAEAGGRYASLHLDSGASTTALSWLFAARYPDLTATAPRRTVHAGGAGGETQAEAAQLPSLDLSFSDETFHLEKVNVQLEHDTAPGPFGTLGQDVLRRVSWYGVDLRTMSLVLGPKLTL